MRSLRNLLPRVETTLLYEHDLAEIVDYEPAAPVEVAALPSPSIELLRQIGPAHPQEVAERVARSDHCFVARADRGRASHFAWVQTSGHHRIGPAGVWLPVGEARAWIYDCYTVEWARGRGIYSRTLASILTDLRDSGTRSVFIYTTRSNRASQRVIERAGFRLTERLRSVRVGPWAVPLSKRHVEAMIKAW